MLKESVGVKSAPNLIDRAQREANFPCLHNALDRQLKMLRSIGVGVEVQRASIITSEMENTLWKLGIVGTHSPKALLNAVFFYNGKNFLLRGVQEHIELSFAQVIRGTNLTVIPTLSMALRITLVVFLISAMGRS